MSSIKASILSRLNPFKNECYSIAHMVTYRRLSYRLNKDVIIYVGIQIRICYIGYIFDCGPMLTNTEPLLIAGLSFSVN